MLCRTTAPAEEASAVPTLTTQTERMAGVDLSPRSLRSHKRSPASAADAGIVGGLRKPNSRRKKRTAGISWPVGEVVTRSELTYSPAEYDRTMPDSLMYSTMCDCCGNDCSDEVSPLAHKGMIVRPSAPPRLRTVGGK